MTTRLTRRTLLTTALSGAAVAAFPLPLRAQAKTFKVGVVHPVTGPLAEPGPGVPARRADGRGRDQRGGRHQGARRDEARARARRHADEAGRRPRPRPSA